MKSSKFVLVLWIVLGASIAHAKCFRALQSELKFIATRAVFSLNQPEEFAQLLRGRETSSANCLRFEPFKKAIAEFPDRISRRLKVGVSKPEENRLNIILGIAQDVQTLKRLSILNFWRLFFEIATSHIDDEETRSNEINISLEEMILVHRLGGAIYPIVQDTPIAISETIRYRPLDVFGVQLILGEEKVHGHTMAPHRFALHDIRHARISLEADLRGLEWFTKIRPLNATLLLYPVGERAWEKYNLLWETLYSPGVSNQAHEAGLLLQQILHEPEEWPKPFGATLVPCKVALIDEILSNVELRRPLVRYAREAGVRDARLAASFLSAVLRSIYFR